MDSIKIQPLDQVLPNRTVSMTESEHSAYRVWQKGQQEKCFWVNVYETGFCGFTYETREGCEKELRSRLALLQIFPNRPMGSRVVEVMDVETCP